MRVHLTEDNSLGWTSHKARIVEAAVFDLGHCSKRHVVFYPWQVMHSFDAEDQGELSLSVGDYVVVRQVTALLDTWSFWPLDMLSLTMP